MTRRAATAAAVVSQLPWFALWDPFTFPRHSENAEPGTVSAATFRGDAVTLEYFDDDKLGTFTR